MKIENAKNLLIAIKEQIAENLSEDRFLKSFLKSMEEFNSLIDSCDDSISYTNFCDELLEKAKVNVSPDHKQRLLIIKQVGMFLCSSHKETKEEFINAAAYAYASAYVAEAAKAAAKAVCYNKYEDYANLNFFQ